VEEKPVYVVEITREAEIYYFNLLEYLYKTHTPENASKKAEEILDMAKSLERYPLRGKLESRLGFLGKSHRFLLYKVTSRKQVKIIYFVNESRNQVYITDFFPTEMDNKRLSKRNKK
jgi:plasmid stabilization system protein ParE